MRCGMRVRLADDLSVSCVVISVAEDCARGADRDKLGRVIQVNGGHIHQSIQGRTAEKRNKDRRELRHTYQSRRSGIEVRPLYIIAGRAEVERKRGTEL